MDLISVVLNSLVAIPFLISTSEKETPPPLLISVLCLNFVCNADSDSDISVPVYPNVLVDSPEERDRERNGKRRDVDDSAQDTRLARPDLPSKWSTHLPMMGNGYLYQYCCVRISPGIVVSVLIKSKKAKHSTNLGTNAERYGHE
ncbi:hypothetical protein MAR_015007 [Mya arenaria]|uniref:Uncharacterized protein n=1 Tax=Mya arenaria TaxID=6604 RepID=A0ABY7FFS0_MYAAR|nr:hypothetical protein MAR_014901 [Mya arenaria]WAR21033.1 hypothetical protein MAR_015007 [Mya arenaria]